MPSSPLSPTEEAVLRTLLSAEGRVMSRTTIARDSGLGHLSARRTDSVIATLRVRLGEDSVVTIRQRGWMLTAVGTVRAREALSWSV